MLRADLLNPHPAPVMLSSVKNLVLSNLTRNKIWDKPFFRSENPFYFNLTSDKAMPCPYI